MDKKLKHRPKGEFCPADKADYCKTSCSLYPILIGDENHCDDIEGKYFKFRIPDLGEDYYNFDKRFTTKPVDGLGEVTVYNFAFTGFLTIVVPTHPIFNEYVDKTIFVSMRSNKGAGIQALDDLCSKMDYKSSKLTEKRRPTFLKFDDYKVFDTSKPECNNLLYMILDEKLGKIDERNWAVHGSVMEEVGIFHECVNNKAWAYTTLTQVSCDDGPDFLESRKAFESIGETEIGDFSFI